MTGGLRLLADDLTGALDAVAPFAAARGPIEVRWTGSFDGGQDLAFDSETRDADEQEAVVRVGGLVGALGAGTPAFKKIDSLLRPNTAAEIATIWRTRRFASLAIAPAFPEQGRRLRAGRLFLGGGGSQVDGGIDLLQALAHRRLPVVALRCGEQPAGPGLYVCDAEADLDLAAVAASAFEPPCLWVGSAGLARALSGRRPHAALPCGPALVLIGTRHQATRSQIAEARPLILGSQGDAAAVAAVAGQRIEAGCATAVVLNVAGENIASARRVWSALARCLARLSPAFVVVVGGESLRRICDELGASHLVAEGEVAPGVPRARIIGGAWNGMPLISKSGAFDDRGLLAKLLRTTAAVPT
jgi:uncharacterized protein YgbK (DUF1537 family)